MINCLVWVKLKCLKSPVSSVYSGQQRFPDNPIHFPQTAALSFRKDKHHLVLVKCTTFATRNRVHICRSRLGSQHLLKMVLSFFPPPNP